MIGDRDCLFILYPSIHSTLFKNMPLTCPTFKAEYVQTIESFTFRESDAIKIPKSVREKAYAMAIDLKIVRTKFPLYLSNKSAPPNSFYGYASLVMEDYLEKEINISMPRQRLYYGRVVEAYIGWQDLINYEYNKKDIVEDTYDLLAAIATNAGIELPQLACCSLADIPWLELPLREVYFKPVVGMQYEIEISYWSPVPFTDSCGNVRDGKSKQTDGDKDGGLPPEGSMPSVSEVPNNPFGGLPPASTTAQQGDFALDKSGNSGNVSLGNVGDPIIPDDWGYFARIGSSYFKNAQCEICSFITYRLINSADVLSITYGTPYSTCGGTGANATLRGSISGVIYGDFPSTNRSVDYSIVRAPSLPPDFNSCA